MKWNFHLLARSATSDKPGDLVLWPFDLEMVRIIARGVANLLTNFGVSGTFQSRFMGQHVSYDLDFWRMRRSSSRYAFLA